MLLKFQFKASFGILHHVPEKYFLIISSSSFADPVLFLTSTLLTLSYHFIPNSRR